MLRFDRFFVIIHSFCILEFQSVFQVLVSVHFMFSVHISCLFVCLYFHVHFHSFLAIFKIHFRFHFRWVGVCVWVFICLFVQQLYTMHFLFNLHYIFRRFRFIPGCAHVYLHVFFGWDRDRESCKCVCVLWLLFDHL